MNKIGMHIGYWWGTDAATDIFQMLELTQRAKLDAIEINPAWMLEMSALQCKEFLKRAKDYHITITLNGGLNPTNDIASDSAEVRKAGIEYCTTVLKKMPMLEIDVWSGLNYSAWLRAPMANSDTMEEKARAWEYSTRSLKEIMKVAENLEIDYCFEVVNRYEQFIFNTAEEAICFAEDVGSSCAKVHLDTFHMNIEEDNMVSAIVYAGMKGKLGHFHAGESNRRIPGVGETNIDWNMVAKALNSIHYKGPIIMEPFVLTTAHNAKNTRVWRNLSKGANLDQLVEDARIGGDFLRKVLLENQ